MNRNQLATVRVIFVVMMIAATYLSLTPHLPKQFIPKNDKLDHAVAYFVLGFTANLAFPAASYLFPKALPLFLYSWLMEILQRHIPGRSYETLDLVANATGLLLYGGAVLGLRKWRARSSPPAS